MDTPRFAHVSFRVADLERTVAFYTKHLGCREGPAFVDDEGRRTGIYLDAGTAFIEIFESDDVDLGNGHLCFEVDDVVTVQERLAAAGVDVDEPFIGRSRAKILFARDPDGHSVEFNEYSDPDCWIVRYRRERL